MTKNNVTFLLDTGSSVCLLSQNVFNNIKHILKYKHLSTSVSLKTVNSHIHFSACIQTSIKIQNKSYSHNFYIVDIPESSDFQGILGYDFINKYHIILDMHRNILEINNTTVPLHFAANNESLTNNVANTNNDAKFNINHAFLNKKIILEPESDTWTTVFTNSTLTKKEYLFEPNISKGLLAFDSIINIPNDENKRTRNLKNPKKTCFQIHIQNNSAKTIHLNKNTKIGQIYEILDIVNPSIDVNGQIVENPEYNSQVSCYIKASKEVLEMRKKDLNASDFTLNHLKNSEKTEMLNLLLTHYAAFSKSLKTLGHTDRVVPNLRFINDFPIKTLPFPIPQSLQKVALDQINQLLEAGIIERNCSDWACPILLVKKKPDGSGKQKYRLALDLRMLNTVIQSSSYPLPKIQNIISNLSKYKYFTSLDFQQAYHQIDLPEKFQDQLTFTSMFGSFKFRRLVFGVKCAASIYQSLMDTLMDEMLFDGVYSYQDDLIFGSNSFQETCEKLTKILQVLSKYNLTLTLNK